MLLHSIYLAVIYIYIYIYVIFLNDVEDSRAPGHSCEQYQNWNVSRRLNRVSSLLKCTIFFSDHLNYLNDIVFELCLFSSDRHITKTGSTSSDRGPEETPFSSSAKERWEEACSRSHRTPPPRPPRRAAWCTLSKDVLLWSKSLVIWGVVGYFNGSRWQGRGVRWRGGTSTQSLSSLSSLAAAVEGMKENGGPFISPPSLSAVSAAGRL